MFFDPSRITRFPHVPKGVPRFAPVDKERRRVGYGAIFLYPPFRTPAHRSAENHDHFQLQLASLNTHLIPL